MVILVHHSIFPYFIAKDFTITGIRPTFKPRTCIACSEHGRTSRASIVFVQFFAGTRVKPPSG